jgi:hypothetical protein
MKRGMLVLTCIIIWACAAPSLAALPVTIDDIKRVVPGAASSVHKIDPVDHHLVKDKKGNVLGVAFVTSSVEPQVRGYGGEIDVLVGMNAKGTVTGVYVISHGETAEYFKHAGSDGFLKRFVGRSVDRGFDDIDAISGATISSNAIKRDVQTAAFEVTKKLIDSGALKKEAGRVPNPFDILAAVAVIVLIAGAIAALLLPRRRWIRYVVWTASVITIGIWLNTPLTFGMFVDLGRAILPAAAPLLILFGFALAAPLLKGNLYCAYLCPFGALQEGAHRLPLPKLGPHERVLRNASWLRWVVLLAVAFAVANGVAAFRTIEPFALCFSRKVAVIALVQAAVVLVVAAFIKRPWCRYFCPTGAILDLVGQLGCRLRGLVRRRRCET